MLHLRRKEFLHARNIHPGAGSISDRKLEANRNNSQLSTGPRTEEGKQRVRFNARRHSLTGQVALLPAEEYKAVEAFCAKLIAHFQPGSAWEMQLAREIAEDTWRLNRARAVENNWFAIRTSKRRDDVLGNGHPQIEDALQMAHTFAERSLEFQRLTLYEQRACRKREKNINSLESARLYRQNAPAAKPPAPPIAATANGGFVFSNDFSTAPDSTLETRSAASLPQPQSSTIRTIVPGPAAVLHHAVPRSATLPASPHPASEPVTAVPRLAPETS